MEGKLHIYLYIILYIIFQFLEQSDYIYLYILPFKLNKKTEEAIIGDMLGDGHINMGNIKK
jgi:hypothetical protein